jgi:hypothetical protein
VIDALARTLGTFITVFGRPPPYGMSLTWGEHLGAGGQGNVRAITVHGRCCGTDDGNLGEWQKHYAHKVGQRWTWNVQGAHALFLPEAAGIIILHLDLKASAWHLACLLLEPTSQLSLVPISMTESGLDKADWTRAAVNDIAFPLVVQVCI